MRIVISGTSSGIGLALAERLLGAGHEVWGLARTDQSALALAGNPRFRHSRCDVASWVQVETAARDINAHWSALDAVVTAAGVQGAVGHTLSLKPDEWSSTVHTNLDGTFYTIRALYPLLVHTARRAKIVCFSGGGATKARPNFAAYGAAKTAVVRLVETIAEEERGTALDINAIAPGAIATRMTDEVLALGPGAAGISEYNAALRQKEVGLAPLHKALDLVEWLLSTDSDGVSGRLLSAPWDPWHTLKYHAGELAKSDIYTLRRIVPDDRDAKW